MSTSVKGFNLFAGWGEEASGAWGTPVARAQFARFYPSSKPTHMRDSRPKGYIARRDVEGEFVPPEFGTGKLIVPLVYSGMGKLFKHLFGAVVDAGAGPSFTHTYTSSDDYPCTGGSGGNREALTMEWFYGIQESGFESFLLYGGRATGWTLDFRQGEEVRLDSDWIGQQVVQAAKTGAPTFPDYDAHTVKPSQLSIQIDNVSAPIKGFNVVVNPNLKTDDSEMPGQYIQAPYPGATPREITGSIARDYINTADASDSRTLYGKFKSGTLAKVVATCTGPTNHSLVFTLAKVRFTGETPEPTLGGQLPTNLPFRAEFDATDTIFKLVETNEVATT